jgi:hypothetical protein
MPWVSASRPVLAAILAGIVTISEGSTMATDGMACGPPMIIL